MSTFSGIPQSLAKALGIPEEPPYFRCDGCGAEAGDRARKKNGTQQCAVQH